MRNLNEYFDTGLTLSAEFDALSDSELSNTAHREQVNERVINFVVKYLGVYLGLEEPFSAEAVDQALKTRLQSQPMAFKNVMLGAMSGDMFGDSDLFSIQCIADLRATAAIFKEIAFADDWENHNDSFYGLDFGTGSGILLAAMLVAANRRKIKNVATVGIDFQATALANVEQALSSFAPPDSFMFEVGDACDPSLHRALLTTPPNMWVSETIALTTPRHFIDEDGELCMKQDPISSMTMELETQNDPFPFVLHASLYADPAFYRRIFTRKMFMFPNPVNCTYAPDESNSTLALKSYDGAHRSLGASRAEFAGFECFTDKYQGIERWMDIDEASIEAQLLKMLDDPELRKGLFPELY